MAWAWEGARVHFRFVRFEFQVISGARATCHVDSFTSWLQKVRHKSDAQSKRFAAEQTRDRQPQHMQRQTNSSQHENYSAEGNGPNKVRIMSICLSKLTCVNQLVSTKASN